MSHAPDTTDAGDFSDLPPLEKDRSFWGMTATQFLGAFNDNVFKQLILLLAMRVADRDLQPVAMAVFSLPFLLFSGYAGYLSDRHSKRRVIVASKVAEIVVMTGGLIAFFSFDNFQFTGLLVVLFLMGTQSAFFGPGKYGILPEILREKDLPRANGIILMTTFLAIISGTAAAGFLSDWSLRGEEAAGVDLAPSRLWMASAVCVAIAVIGTVTSTAIRVVAPSNKDLRFDFSALAVGRETRKMLWADRPLMVALLASCMFWMLAGVTQQAVNSLGKVQLQLSDQKTSLLAASIGVGIALGAMVAGRFSRGTANFRVMRLGAAGMVTCLALLAVPGPQNGQLWGFAGSMPLLILLGMSAGVFAIPLQVFLQSRPPEGQKGRVIAVMNQANFVAILASAGVYFLFDQLVLSLGWNRSSMFVMASILMLPVAIGYRGTDDQKPAGTAEAAE